MIFDLVENTPPVYTEESRDFQLFLRIYNSVVNQMITDNQLMLYITDSKKCKEELLNLLKSRVGFNTDIELTSRVLRDILKGFTEILKNKGTIKGIIQTVNLFLKALDLASESMVLYSENGEVISGYTVSDHTIIIGLSEVTSNYYILDELLRYILPAGIGVSYHFLNSYSKYDWIRDLNNAELLFVGKSLSDSIRYNSYDSSVQYQVGSFVMYEDHKVYECIQATLGNIPPTSVDYWKECPVATRVVNSVGTLGIYSGENPDSSHPYDDFEIFHNEDNNKDYSTGTIS